MLLKSAVFLNLLVIVGCAHKSPLLVPEQAKLIKTQDKSMKGYGTTVQEKIRTASSSGALVVTGTDKGTSPAVFPGEDPVVLTAANLDAVSSGNSCIWVSKSALAAPPFQLSCSSLVTQAKNSLAVQARDEKQDADLASLRNDLTALRADLETLDKSVKADEAKISSDRADINRLGGVLGPMANIVSFHEGQLKQMEKMLNRVGARYQKTIATVGENNKQIESMISDMNNAFAQTRQRLDAIQQQLDSIAK